MMLRHRQLPKTHITATTKSCVPNSFMAVETVNLKSGSEASVRSDSTPGNHTNTSVTDILIRLKGQAPARTRLHTERTPTTAEYLFESPSLYGTLKRRLPSTTHPP